MKKTILIVEDESRLATLHQDYLNQAGFETVCLADGLSVVPWLKNNATDMVLLDLMLPGKDGIEICKEIRTFSSVPIIIVTARVEEIDRLLGLELGADDYICKPFSPREVLARVKAVLRRCSDSFVIQNLLQLDSDKNLATLQGKKLDLTAVEFQLLNILAGKPGRIFTRDQLMDNIYTDRRIVCDRTIDSHIKKLRKKISGASPDLQIIHSVYGLGYKYDPPENLS